MISIDQESSTAKMSLSFNTLRLAVILLFSATVFSLNAFAQTGSTNVVDSTFNAQITTTSYNQKSVNAILPLPNGKIVVGGRFNSYNGVSVGSVVRLNADGSLDNTFVTDTISEANQYSSSGVNFLAAQADGKILVAGVFTLSGETTTRPLVRLNADGTLDTNFSFTVPTYQFGVRKILVRPNGKIVVCSESFTTPSGTEGVIQLNSDGSLDTSFDAAVPNPVPSIELQNGKLIALYNYTSEIARLNDDGSLDSTFSRRVVNFSFIHVQPDGKIIGQSQGSPFLVRLNADGTPDASFQYNSQPFQQVTRVAVQSNGNLIIASGGNPYTVSRLQPNGALDSSFPVYTQNISVYALAVQADGKVIVGDQVNGLVTSPITIFGRFNVDGTRDATFNAGTGFQFLTPGKVEGFAVQANGKIVIGGRFDLINGVSRYRMARLNENGSLDDTFQISTTATNRFVTINEIQNLALQSDGKIIVSGMFQYSINGVTKNDLARLNSDGSIDPTFNLSVLVLNSSGGANSGKNKITMRPNNKMLIAGSRISNNGVYPAVPFVVNADGSRDTTFNSTYKADASGVFIYDLSVLPNNKILIGGRYIYGGVGNWKSFVARLNADGAVDSSFAAFDEDFKVVKAFTLMPDNKILVGKGLTIDESNAEITRLNADGTADASFKTLPVNGKINAMIGFGNGKILVGGAFTKVDNTPRRNLAVLNADGTLDSTIINVNQEVLSFSSDNQGRILVGGAFTVINTGGGNVNVNYLARLVAQPDNSGTAKARFDFDGDGRSDVALFNQNGGIWTIRQSRNNQTTTTQFGKIGDVPVAADYDNDGKTDIAVYRPSDGVWYLQQSTNGFAAVRWGLPEDKPMAADYDGDGKADIAIWRPSTRVWYIQQSSNNQMRAVYFGLSTDIPLRDADFDGDGKADIAVFRPSNGAWYYLASGSNDEFKVVLWGASGDVPVPSDYNGDGKTDFVVFRPSEAVWYQQLSGANGISAFNAMQFGANGDVPLVGDYNGDGKADIAVRRGALWAFQLSGQSFNALNFGNTGDQAVAGVLP